MGFMIWSFEIFNKFLSAFPTAAAPKNKVNLNIDFFKPTADLSYLLWIIGIFIALIFLFAFLNERFLRSKNKKEFLAEMRELNLEPEVATTLSDIAQKNDIREPVDILYSPRLFDEIAIREMVKILTNSTSQKTKEIHINNLYTARKQAFQTTHSSRLEGEKFSAIPDKKEPVSKKI